MKTLFVALILLLAPPAMAQYKPNTMVGPGTVTVDGELILWNGTTGLKAKRATGTGFVKVTSGVMGTPSSSVSLTSEVSGVLPIANGGRNSSAALSGSSIMVSNGTAIVQGAAGTSTQVLHGNAAGTPTYSAVSLTADVTGTLPVANGGTGLATLTANGVLIGNGTSSPTFVTSSTSGHVLTWNGSAWVASASSGAADLVSTPSGTNVRLCSFEIGSGCAITQSRGGCTSSCSGTTTKTLTFTTSYWAAAPVCVSNNSLLNNNYLGAQNVATTTNFSMIGIRHDSVVFSSSHSVICHGNQ